MMKIFMMSAALLGATVLFTACGDDNAGGPYTVTYSATVSGSVTLDTLVYLNESSVFSPAVLSDTTFNGSLTMPQGATATIRAKGEALNGRVILTVQAVNANNSLDDSNDRTLVGNVSQPFDFNASVFLQ